MHATIYRITQLGLNKTQLSATQSFLLFSLKFQIVPQNIQIVPLWGMSLTFEIIDLVYEMFIQL